MKNMSLKKEIHRLKYGCHRATMVIAMRAHCNPLDRLKHINIESLERLVRTE